MSTTSHQPESSLLFNSSSGEQSASASIPLDQIETLKTETMSSIKSRQADMQEERVIFEKARQFLKPGPFFRFVTYLYAERKLVVFFLIHFMCTMIIWGESCCESSLKKLECSPSTSSPSLTVFLSTL